MNGDTAVQVTVQKWHVYVIVIFGLLGLVSSAVNTYNGFTSNTIHLQDQLEQTEQNVKELQRSKANADIVGYQYGVLQAEIQQLQTQQSNSASEIINRLKKLPAH